MTMHVGPHAPLACVAYETEAARRPLTPRLSPPPEEPVRAPASLALDTASPQGSLHHWTEPLRNMKWLLHPVERLTDGHRPGRSGDPLKYQHGRLEAVIGS